MKLSGKVYFASLLLTVLLCFSIRSYAASLHKSPSAEVNVFVLVETAETKHWITGGNVITNTPGERYIRNILGFDNESSQQATKWISVSNDASPVATWTKLATEKTADGFTRAIGTVSAWINSGDYAYNVSKKFTSTSDSIQLQCAGLQWSETSDSDNNLFACAAFTQTTFNTDDNCTIVWVITINAN